MRLVFAGTPEVAVPSLQALLSSRHEVVAVLTRPDAGAGRGRRMTSSPVKDLAVTHGLPVLQPEHPRDPQFQAELAALEPDCVPVVAYGALVPASALTIPRYGWVNLHFSLLPAWRGAAPVQRCLLAGDEITGATTFLLEAGMDTGPVFGVLTETVLPHDTSGDLLDRLAQAGGALLLGTLDAIADGTARPVPQPSEGISFAPKLTVGDVRVDWQSPAQHVDRLIRAATPAPGAWTTFRGGRVKLGPVRLVPTDPPVTELAAGELSGDRVGTGSGIVLLGQVKPEGKAWMACADWANGVRPKTGECFV